MNYKEFKNVGLIKYDEPMKLHTTFRIGGPADIFIEPTNTNELINAIKIAKNFNIPYLIMGNGSNMLVTDKGIRGAVIKLGEHFSTLEADDNLITAKAGAKVTSTAKFALKHSLSGMENISGIPGSVGGGVMMNAGAYGSEFKDVVKEVKVLDRDLNIKTLKNEELEFSYRNSIISREDLIVLEVVFELQKGEHQKILEHMRDVTEKRNSKQPLTLPSAGSVFKRPEGYFAAKLIEDSGLKGLRHRGAQVSDKHAGFIVNIDDASCKEVLDLIGVVISTVKDKFGVTLEREVRIFGEE